VSTAYLRLDHDAHWLSDTVGRRRSRVAAAKFVMRRREGTEPRGELSVRSVEGERC